jgi:hypothetical protein
LAEYPSHHPEYYSTFNATFGNPKWFNGWLVEKDPNTDNAGLMADGKYIQAAQAYYYYRTKGLNLIRNLHSDLKEYLWELSDQEKIEYIARTELETLKLMKEYLSQFGK